MTTSRNPKAPMTDAPKGDPISRAEALAIVRQAYSVERLTDLEAAIAALPSLDAPPRKDEPHAALSRESVARAIYDAIYPHGHAQGVASCDSATDAVLALYAAAQGEGSE